MVNLTPSADVSSYLRDLEKFGIKLGLDNMNLLCEALAHPERTFKSLVIGGTNGKGSVAAMTEAALRADGYHTGRYTSPHLIRLEERISIAGKPITTRDFEWAVELSGMQSTGCAVKADSKYRLHSSKSRLLRPSSHSGKPKLNLRC